MAPALACRIAWKPGSFDTDRPARLVMPNAVSVAFFRVVLGGEQLGVGDIGAGIAALDVIKAQLVQHPDDQPLVLERKVDPRRLRPVAQRRVEQIEPLLVMRVHFAACATALSR